MPRIKVTPILCTLALLASTTALTHSAYAHGLSISLNGESIVEDQALETVAQEVGLKIEQANVTVDYDNTSADKSLILDVFEHPQMDKVFIKTTSNYPNYIKKSEIRLYERSLNERPKLLGAYEVKANGTAEIDVPLENVDIVYRVYGKRGRYDETTPIELGIETEEPNQNQFSDTLDTDNINVAGSTVTVAATNIAAGGSLSAFGHNTRASRDGSAVIERILPSGNYDLDVVVLDQNGTINFGESIEVDSSQLVYFVVADVEYWRRQDLSSKEYESGNSARLQVFVDGQTKGGVSIIGSLDTAEGPIEDIFTRLDEKDPRSMASRLEVEPPQITYGDDSTQEDTTPTSGRLYFKAQKNENYFLWGDFATDINGSQLIRNDRSQYGAKINLESAKTTQTGDPRLSFTASAGQRDQLFGREEFRGTDGTVYFLSRNDITRGTTTIEVEVRDAITGRTIERKTLRAGDDYIINEFQGVIRLNDPISASSNSSLIETQIGGDEEIYLIANYEYTPIGSSDAGFNLSGRGEAWASDNLRIGATALSQSNGTSTQKAYSGDIRYHYGKNSFVQLDYAQTEGPGFNFLSSNNSGLSGQINQATAGEGSSAKLSFDFDLADINPDAKGNIGGYAETRTQGFSTLDTQVSAATGDQILFGFYAKSETSTGLKYGLSLDHIDNETGAQSSVVNGFVATEISSNVDIELAAEHQIQKTNTSKNQRTDLAARLNFTPTDNSRYYAYIQQAVLSKGIAQNNRYGLGSELKFQNGWALNGEISDGSTGTGLSFGVNKEDEAGNTTYFGWEVDPDRTQSTNISQSDNQHFVLGGRRQVSEKTHIYAEQNFDFLGPQNEFSNSFGLEFTPREKLTYGATVVFADLQNDASGDIERKAYSFSAAYTDSDLQANARVEVRQDEEVNTTGNSNTDTIVLSGNLAWKINNSSRATASVIANRTKSDTNSFVGGKYIDASLGYAYRPVLNEKLNFFLTLRHLNDDFGQEINGTAGAGPVQLSQVINIEGNYDLTPRWTVGGKFGARKTRSASQKGTAYTDNDAWLSVVNARYRLNKKWDGLVELRHFNAVDTKFSETGALASIYYHLGENAQIGAGYNFTNFSDDLTDLTQNEQGFFLNVIAKF